MELLRIPSFSDWLAIVGFIIVFVQATRARRTAAAVKDELGTAARRVSLYNFLLLVPELTRLEGEMDRATRDGDAEAVRRLLKDWRNTLTDLQGILASEEIEAVHLEGLIEESRTQAAISKGALEKMIGAEGDLTDDLLKRTKRLRTSTDAVCVETRRLGSQVRSSVSLHGLPLSGSATSSGAGGSSIPAASVATSKFPAFVSGILKKIG